MPCCNYDVLSTARAKMITIEYKGPGGATPTLKLLVSNPTLLYFTFVFIMLPITTMAQVGREQGEPDVCYCPCNATEPKKEEPSDRPKKEGATEATVPPREEERKLPGDLSPDIPEILQRNPFAFARTRADFCMADLAFVLDASGSVTASNWEKMLKFVQDFAERVNFGLSSNRIGVVSYANSARLDIKLNEYGSLNGFRNSVSKIQYQETSTNTAEGLRVMRTELFTPINGDRPSFPNIAIVMTDGESVIQPEDTIPEAELARDQGIIVFVVGIGNQLKQTELEGISNDPNSQFLYNVEDFDTLISRVDEIANAACEVTTCTRNDIAFVLDSSGSIGANNWMKVTEFVSEFVNNLAIGPDYNQIGIVTYSTLAELNMRLDEHPERAELMESIQKLPWKNHRTNTSGGLRIMRRSIFDEQLGDRRDAPNIAIVMTDGYSNVDAQLTEVEADLARQNSIRIFAIGVGDLVEMDEISAIANDPGYYYEFLLRTFDDLVTYTRRIFDVICSPTEPSPSLDFSRCRVDFGFVLDGSASVGRDNWQRIIAFMKDLAQRLDIGPAANQIGIVTFGDSATLDVRLNDHASTGAFVAAMDKLAYRGQASNMAAGLKLAREQLFSGAQNGDRLEVPDILMIITNGETAIDRESTVSEAEAARADDITIFAVGVGSTRNQGELKDIANKPSSFFVYEAPDFQTLIDNYERLLGSACYSTAREIWQCTFDDEDDSARLCGAQQVRGSDQFDWTIWSGPTPSAYTGPSAAFSGLYFAYIEASSPRIPGDEARLVLPMPQTLSGTYCLMFYINMYGYHVGALQVYVRRSNTDVTRWTSYGPHGQEWLQKFVDLRLQPGDQVAIRATRANGYAGDIAVDSLRMTEGSCPF